MTKYFKKSVSLILSMLMVFSAFVPVFGATTASDYENHWAKDVIQSAVDSGVVKGYPDGTFKPDNAITRAEFFTLVNKSMQFTASSEVTYTDVAPNAWYAPVIASAQAAGYISGYPDGSIHPDGNITRQEAAVVLSKLKALTATSSTLSFTDASAVGEWSKLAVLAVVEAKIMIGYPDGSFQPQAQIKRAEALVAINNGVNYPGTSIVTGTVYDKAGVFGSTTGSATIEGNVVIKAAGVTLQNTIVNGDLTITKDVGEGDVTLKNVTVKGDIIVNGGGVNSIYLIDVTAGKVFVMKDGGPVRIVASGTTEIDEVIAGSDVKLEEVDLTGAGFVGITVEKNAAGGIDITLVNVKLESVDIMAEGVTLNMDKNSTIDTLTLDAKAAITGAGVVAEAIVNANGVTFQTKPTKMTVAEGITAPVIKPPSSGGGGGGGGGSTTESPVVSLAVANDGSIIEGQEDGEVLTLTLTNDTFVAANITTGSTTASVTMTGLPTGVTVGSVTDVTTSSLKIILEGNSTVDYDTNITATVHVASTALALAGGDETATIDFVAIEEITALDASQMILNTVTGAGDNIDFTGLAAGSVIKVYDAATAGNVLPGTLSAITGGAATYTLTNDLGTLGTNIWVTVTSATDLESARVAKAAQGE